MCLSKYLIEFGALKVKQKKNPKETRKPNEQSSQTAIEVIL